MVQSCTVQNDNASQRIRGQPINKKTPPKKGGVFSWEERAPRNNFGRLKMYAGRNEWPLFAEASLRAGKKERAQIALRPFKTSSLWK